MIQKIWSQLRNVSDKQDYFQAAPFKSKYRFTFLAEAMTASAKYDIVNTTKRKVIKSVSIIQQYSLNFTNISLYKSQIIPQRTRLQLQNPSVHLKQRCSASLRRDNVLFMLFKVSFSSISG